MKKIPLIIFFLLLSLVSFSQVLNQSANWPNTDWTVTGTYNTDPTAFEADPTVTANFAFDDDDAGAGSDDDIAAESPIIDLTPTFNAGETWLFVNTDFTYNQLGGSLNLEYWDSDSASWVVWEQFFATTDMPNDEFCSGARDSFESVQLNISAFTATQQTGFRYRISFSDDAGNGGGGFQWGFCFDAPTITSQTPPACPDITELAVANISGSSVDISWNAGNTETQWEYVVQAAGTGEPSGAGTSTNSNTITVSSLDFSTAYEVYVRGNCDTDGFSNWIGPVNFSTAVQTEYTIDCTAAPTNIQYCYQNNDTTNWTFTSTDGSSLRITFNAGSIEGGFDNFTIYDGTDNTGTILFNNNNTNQNEFAGLLFESTSDSLFLELNSDGSVSCDSGAQEQWDFTVVCATCANPTATYVVNEDCANGPQFFVDVDLTDLGSATSITISDNQGSATQTTAAVGLFTFGPFVNNTDVQITVANDDDTNCVLTSPTLTQEQCVLNFIDCAAGPTDIQYCYVDDDTTTWVFSSTDGTPLRIAFDSGTIEGFFDFLRIYDGFDNTGTLLYESSADFGTVELAGLLFQSTGDSLYLEVTSDGSVSCESGSQDEWNFSVSCATCILPEATYTIVDDCENGDQFLIDVNVTNIGDAATLTISDNQGSTPVQVNATGTTQFGPYPFLTDIIITVANDDDSNCIINSGTIQQLACPPDNDNCENATIVIANDGIECVEITSATLTAASASTQANDCVGEANDDVWFEFVATSTDHAISLQNIQGTFDLVHAVYEGDCDTLTELYCSDPNESTANALTIGNTYKIRVFSFNNEPLQTITFDLCIISIPPPLYVSTTDFTVEELVEDVLVDSDCQQVFNVTFSTGTNFGFENGIGYFEENGSGFPLERGLVLISGDANEVPGPEDGILSTGGWPGDADLENAIPDLGAGASNDATIIEFDFIPVINTMSFDFIFAAEEYGTFQCQFADSFAFLLTDPDGVTTNLALVPGTTDPISVFTIRDNIHNSDCDSVNPEFFGNFYGDTGLPPIAAPIDLMGHTVVMTASSNVIPNEQYHIKMVIADADDNAYNSAVFLGGGSFDIGQLDLGGDILLSSGDAQCEGTSITLDAGEQPNNSTITWYQDGVVIDGETGTTLDVNTTAFYRADIIIDGTDCTFSDEILVEFFLNPDVVPVQDTVVRCIGLEVTLEVTIANPGDLLDPIEYTWNFEGTELQVGPSNTYTIPADSDLIGEVTVFANDARLCTGETTITVAEGDSPIIEPIVSPVGACIGGEVSIGVNVVNNDDLSGDYTYLWSVGGMEIATGSENTILYVVNNLNDVVDVTITDNVSQCSGITSISFAEGEEPAVTPLEAIVDKCIAEDATLEVSISNDANLSGDYTYSWSIDGVVVQEGNDNTFIHSANEPEAQVTVVVKDNISQCEGEATIDVVYYINDGCLDLPQGLSPNNDGDNDCLILDHLDDKLDIDRIDVFNRYGIKVFELNDYVDQWCGTDNEGDRLAVGTYFYTIYFNTDNDPITSWIYLNY